MNKDYGFSSFPVKPRTALWLHTRNHDHYVGLIASTEGSDLSQRHLLVVLLSPMVKVERFGHAIWHSIERRDHYVFNLTIVSVTERDRNNRLKAKTSDGDEIVIINTEDEEIDRLIAQPV